METVDTASFEELRAQAAAEWLRSPGPVPEVPFGTEQTLDEEFPGALPGGLPGHVRFYVLAAIPNLEKRRFLLHAIYVMAWRDLSLLFPRAGLFRTGPEPVHAEEIYGRINSALQLADASGDEGLGRWARAVRFVLHWKKHPRHAYWCRWGWSWQWPLTYLYWP